MIFRSYWFDRLNEAKSRLGDPLTGECYVLKDGEYWCGQKRCGDQIVIAFDASTNQTLKHGLPEEVEQYAINARKSYSQREDDIRLLPPALVVVRMPRLFDDDSINRVLRSPRYLAELMKKPHDLKGEVPKAKLLNASSGRWRKVNCDSQVIWGDSTNTKKTTNLDKRKTGGRKKKKTH